MPAELYAEGTETMAGRHAMQPVPSSAARPQEAGYAEYAGSVSATRSASDYTVRILPSYPGVKVPLEVPYVLWQR
jgi:hypothetical protein